MRGHGNGTTTFGGPRQHLHVRIVDYFPGCATEVAAALGIPRQVLGRHFWFLA